MYLEPNNETFDKMIDEKERYRQWRRRKDRKWAKAVFPWRWLQQYQLHHDWYRGRVLYFLGAKEHRERDEQIRIRELMAAGYAGPNSFPTERGSMKLTSLRHRDKRYKRLIRNKETLHRYKRWMRQMSKGSKQLYLITGTEGGWKWRLSFSVSQKQRKWLGSFDFTESKKLHTQKTIYLTGGAVKGCEWQLSVNVSDKGQLRANFYFRAGKAGSPHSLSPSPSGERAEERGYEI